MTDTETKLAEALRLLYDRIDYITGADSRDVAEKVKAALHEYDTASAQPASVADGFASWGDWLESLTDDELVTIFYHYPDAANRMKRLLAATPQPAKESDR